MEGLIGMIKLAITNQASGGWIPCDGSILPIAAYPELFAVLGSRFGGDGKEFFGLPKPVQQGAGFQMIRAKSTAKEENDFVGLVSQIVLWAGEKIPKAWLPCDGQTVAGSDYPLLQKIAAQGMPMVPESFDLPKLPKLPGLQYIICVKGKDPNTEMQM